MSRFVLQRGRRDDGFELGERRDACGPPSTGCSTYVVMDVTLGAGRLPRLPQASRPGRDDHRHRRSDRAIARRRSRRARPGLTRSTSTRTSCTARTTTSASGRSCKSCWRRQLGRGGYSAVDVSERRALGVAAGLDACRSRSRGGRAPLRGGARSGTRRAVEVVVRAAAAAALNRRDMLVRASPCTRSRCR